MAFKRCGDCGFGAEESQFDKTTGMCPRCNPDKARRHAARARHFSEGGTAASLPESAREPRN